MDYLRIVDWSRLQHFKDRRPPWIKAYVDRLDPKTPYGAKYWSLSKDAKLLLPIMELLASTHEPPGLIPNEPGWLAYELRMLGFSARQMSKLISELQSTRLVELISVAEEQTAFSDISFDSRFPKNDPNSDISSPYSVVSESLYASSSPTGEGVQGEGLAAELPPHLRISPALALAVEHYRLAAARAGWPGIRDTSLRRIEQKFLEVDAELRREVEDFDWLVCFGRGVEQPFITTISSFNFEWFLRREFSGTRLNALKVWDQLFREKPGGDDEAERQLRAGRSYCIVRMEN